MTTKDDMIGIAIRRIQRLETALALYANPSNWASPCDLAGSSTSDPDAPRTIWIGANGHGWEPAEVAMGKAPLPPVPAKGTA